MVFIGVAAILGYWDYCMKYPTDYLEIQEFRHETEEGDEVVYIGEVELVQFLTWKQNTCDKAKQLLKSIISIKPITN